MKKETNCCDASKWEHSIARIKKMLLLVGVIEANPYVKIENNS
jgi:hypothetical protein